MMGKLEKRFFDTFGIEARELEYPDNFTYYPEITDHILLELICLHNIYVWGIHSNSINELKNILLEKYIEHVNLMADENEKQEYIQQVQALFKEDNE